MDKNQEWHRPQLEQLEITLDTASPSGSGSDPKGVEVDPSKLFGNVD